MTLALWAYRAKAAPGGSRAGRAGGLRHSGVATIGGESGYATE